MVYLGTSLVSGQTSNQRPQKLSLCFSVDGFATDAVGGWDSAII